MDKDDAIYVSSDDERHEKVLDRRAILAPAIYNVIAALGGYENDTYQLGDECYGCLKDLKKFWRKDDTDDERTVARIFWEARVLSNDLVPILLETAGKGLVEDKCAIACADIVTAMTWPIDLSAELKELDEEFDKGTDYTQLLQSHLHYKAALTHPGVIQALLGILLPCIAKDRKERKERDNQIVNVVLHLFRNLAFIRDPPPNMHASADQAELSTLQSKLVKAYSEAHVLDLLLTIASNSADPFFNQYNTLVLETFYLLFRGVLPSSLSLEESKRTQGTLSRLLEAENKIKVENTRNASSRHSRFGTTITVTLNNAKKQAKGTESGEVEPSASGSRAQTIVSHRQQALVKDAGTVLDLKKRKTWKKTNVVDELGIEDSLTREAKNTLRNLAQTFIETCFNPFLASLLKDIKSERPKITEKDHLRLLFVTKWFLDFFLAIRARQKEAAQKNSQTTTVWDFELVGEVVERGWIVWILKRMREAMEEKPKLWTELQAGIECLTQLLLLIDNMSSSEIADPELNEASELLQQQIIYNGEVLEISVESLRSYKEGVQSLRYLDSSVKLAYTLLRMLERWAKMRGNGELCVRKRKKKRSKKNKTADGDAEDEEMMMDQNASDSDHAIQEIVFTFETFELKFAHEEITHTLLTYLARYQDFDSMEQMKRVVNLLHRQAVKTKAEGLFFKVSTLNLFRSILSRQSSLPKEQPYKDLVALITYIVKKFFKAVNEDPLLIVEAFFPKNRNRWKKFSSWEPEAKESKRGPDVPNNNFPPDVQVKKGYTWSEQLGIAIACLVENGQQELIDWTKEILTMVIGIRQRIVEETDGSSSQSQLDDMDDDDAVREVASKLHKQPSVEAMAKFTDYSIPYISDEQADAATRNPQLKLVFRLVKFYILDDNADELEWYVPAAILPSDLQSSLNVINQFLEHPLDLGGKLASQLLSKRTRRRRRRAASDDEDEDRVSSDDEEPRKRKAKKKKEKEVYKSAQFIEDSDAEYGDDDIFWEKERALRERTERLAAEGKIATMRATGTKKRKKRSKDDEAKKRLKGSLLDSSADEDENSAQSNSDSESDADVVANRASPSTPATTPPQEYIEKQQPKPKRKPRPRYSGKVQTKAPEPADKFDNAAESPVVKDRPEQLAPAKRSADAGYRSDVEDDVDETSQVSRKKRGRIVLSDEDE